MLHLLLVMRDLPSEFFFPTLQLVPSALDTPYAISLSLPLNHNFWTYRAFSVLRSKPDGTCVLLLQVPAFRLERMITVLLVISLLVPVHVRVAWTLGVFRSRLAVLLRLRGLCLRLRHTESRWVYDYGSK